MQIKLKLTMKLLSILAAAVILVSILDFATGAPERLIVQNTEISPKVANIGEIVRVKASIRNNGAKTIKGNAKAFVGESVVEDTEITIPPKDSIPLLFSVNTSSSNEGNYAVDLVIDQTSGEQTIFDLGTITVEPETTEPETTEPETTEPETTEPETTEPETTEPETVNQLNYTNSIMLCLLIVFPVGALVSFFVWKRQRSKKKDDKLSKDLLPNLLNEVLNFEENAEKGAVEKKSSDQSSYVC